MAELAVQTKNMDIRPEQIQDFTPTPMTLSTVMFYTGINPYTMKRIYSPITLKHKQRQRIFFFWYLKSYRMQILAVLKDIGRNDLIVKLLGISKK